MGIRSKLNYYFNKILYPSTRVNRLPKTRPSKESIYYLINQLGVHKPVGLTHNKNTGYHELPFPSLRFPVSRRDLSLRLKRLEEIDIISKGYGLDVGCALGGMTFGLQLKGANMVGTDRDLPSLNVAIECEKLFKTGASFENLDFNSDSLKLLVKKYSNPISSKFDFAIWFSSFNWVVNSLGEIKIKKLVKELSESVDFLIADSAIGGKGSSSLSDIGVIDNQTFTKFILDNSNYRYCNKIGVDEKWYGREIFIFSLNDY